jgi:mannose-6-phosphate isomerase-like protein (cupin superfamily)
VKLAGQRLPAEGFVIAEWKDDGVSSADRPIAGLHVHHQDDEAWYVLEGRLGFRIGDDIVEAGPGEAVLAARGVAHSYWNASSGLTRYLIVVQPRLMALIDELHSGPADYHAVFRKYQSELL